MDLEISMSRKTDVILTGWGMLNQPDSQNGLISWGIQVEHHHVNIWIGGLERKTSKTRVGLRELKEAMNYVAGTLNEHTALSKPI